MSAAIAVSVALLLLGASFFTGSSINPMGGASTQASAVSPDAGVRIDPEG